MMGKPRDTVGVVPWNGHNVSVLLAQAVARMPATLNILPCVRHHHRAGVVDSTVPRRSTRWLAYPDRKDRAYIPCSRYQRARAHSAGEYGPR